MVKPDVKQNYYADLELPTTASIDDIRKAYRKLALQYHPDRNAGREAECVPRFQAIQAANEVLSDPVLKAKYDQDRRKAGLYPAFKASGPVPTGNPYTATSAYPPPPRRTQPGTWQRPQASAYGQPSGADRFSNFPKPGNAGPRRDPAAERTQQFRAWQNMNSGPERPKYGPGGPAPPPPPRSPNPQAQAQAPPPPQPQNTGRPRMQRQDTKMPTEEQIRAGMRHGKTPSQGDSPAAEKQSAWQAFQTGNAGKPGMPTGAGRPRRAAPTTPKRPAGFDPNAPGSDERAAPTSTGHYSHRNRSEDIGKDGFPPPPPGPPPATAPSSPTTPNGRPFADPLRPFRSRETEGEVPYAEGNRARTPYSSFIGEKTQFSSDGLRRSASTRDTNRLNPESNKTSSARAQSSSPPLARKQGDTTQTNGTAKSKPFIPGMYSDSSDSTEDSSDAEQNNGRTENDGSNGTHPDRPRTDPNDGNPFQPPPPRDRPIRKPKPPSSRLNGSNVSGSNVSPERGESGAQFDADHPTMQQRKSSTNIFTFSVHDDTFSPTGGKNRSAEEINTNFSPGGWSGEFKGTPDFKSKSDYFAGRKPSPGRRTPNSRQGRPATVDVPPVSTDMPPPPRPDGSASMYASPSEVKFSEEQWKSTFKDASWTWQQNGTGSGQSSKTPSRKNSSRLRTQTSADDFAPGSKERPHVIVDDEHVNEADSGGARAAAVDVDDAMDIDTPPPASQPFTAPDQSASSTKEPRLYSVPPSAWRQEQQKKQDRKPSHRRTSTEPQLATNLDDLAHVEPLARNAEGLQNLADMSSTLPFDSQAAHGVSDKSKDPDRLQMPPVPKVPEKPVRLTKTSWHSYALSFGNYLQHFHAFNKTMLAHMDARQKQAEARLLRGSLWLEAGGDTSDNQGFDSYLKGVREDEQVRETWNIGSEKHLEAVNDFDKMRDRVKKLAASGALVDA